ncbi:lysophospholipid acyltransferase family protein [Isoalcanivorax beigongshangi]|uniref:Lysophospholipid acyltransferase family protein n=1 Tax=Isoalcanivorax beigongshangi TaxID=3238810 RepID=A0ABV4AH46_9GAMM
MTEPVIGAQVPRRGNGLTRWLGIWLLKLIGWRIVGQLPNVPKAVVIGAPHTSNYDGIVAAGVILALQVRITLMAKSSLFRGPLGPLVRWLGCIPIRRDSREGVVAQTLAAFDAHPQLFLGLAPEGTRHAATAFRSGFYHIAEQGQLPIVVAVIDYGRKELRFADCFVPSGDQQADFVRIFEHYRHVTPRHPARLSAPLKALSETDINTATRNQP